ncbi:hypothetical protein Lal_00025658 [Lupinus albus]|nr:hypothetical protein Lal_00025658 [Lupinus albus]
MITNLAILTIYFIILTNTFKLSYYCVHINSPSDWNGDPCLPKGNSWTGVSCFQHDLISRVITVNLTNVGLDGSLPATIGNLTSLLAQGNKIFGTLPDMSGLHELQIFLFESNSGSYPAAPPLMLLNKFSSKPVKFLKISLLANPLSSKQY